MKYTVPKGLHRFLPVLWGPTISKRIERKLLFGKDWIYDLGYPDQLDWIKIYGRTSISWKFWKDPHVNSQRICARYAGNRNMEIAAYWYENGIRMDQVLDVVPLGEEFFTSIVYNRGSVTFTCRKKSLTVDGSWTWIGRRLGPYFGGNQTAPHTIDLIMLKS